MFSLVILAGLLQLLPMASSEKFGLLDNLMNVKWPKLLGQKPNTENGSYEEFRDFLLNDDTNDEIANATVQQIIKRSGFEFESHRVISDDNYITLLVRLVNPKANRSQLKQPPIMMMDGGFIGPPTYVLANSIQHHPEKYPRGPSDGPMTSWNRSLAFVLANNGFDVWLVGTRGHGEQNQQHLELKGPKSIDQKRSTWKLGMLLAKRNRKLQKQADHYWMFTMDDVIKNEVPRQMEKVIQETGAKNVSIVTYSQSTQIAISLVSRSKLDARKVHSLVSMAPVFNDKGTNWLVKYYYRAFCKYFPNKLGTRLTSEYLSTKPIRDLLNRINKNKYLRYSLVKAIETTYFGSSPKYLTHLEAPLVWHSLMPVSFQHLKHFCQQVTAGGLQKYDYGYLGNMQAHRQYRSLPTDISDLHIKNWMVISGSNDNLASPASMKKLLNEVKKPKPYKHLDVKGFNHLDLIAGITNDVNVNLPVLEFFNHFQLEQSSAQSSSVPRNASEIKNHADSLKA